VSCCVAEGNAFLVRTAEPLPLDEIAKAHDRVDSGTRDRVLIAVLN
jgi:hypothetical protein